MKAGPMQGKAMMQTLNCRSVRGRLWEYVAGTLRETERGPVAVHLHDCEDCDRLRAEYRSVRLGLKSLPAKKPSPLLETQLRVVASRERARRLQRMDFAGWMKELRIELRLAFDNVLRPLAVPAAGGVLASCLCFGMIVDTLHLHAAEAKDVPTALFAQATIETLSPFTVGEKDTMVMLRVDENGRVTDFSVPRGRATADELSQIGNLVLYSTFLPARAFGQRVSSNMLVEIQHMDVKD